MQNSDTRPVGRGIDQEQLSLYRDYRRLVVRSYVLRLRIGWLNVLVTVLGPFALLGLMPVLRRWFDNVKQDVAEFSRVSRAFRVQLRAQPREFQNPWV